MCTSQVLDSVYPKLSRCLNIGNVLPYLKQAQLLTDDEEQQLELSPHNTSQDAARKLVRFLKSKGSGLSTAELFLSALKQAREADVHLGHDEIIEELQERLSDVSLTDSVYYRRERTAVPTIKAEFEETGCEHDSNAKVITSLDSNAPMEYGQLEYVSSPHRKLLQRQKDVVRLRCKVVEDSQQIVTTFATLVLSVYRLVCRLQVPVEEIRIFLLFMKCSKLRPQMNMFDGTKSEIVHANDLGQLITCLHEHSSWFNYHLIKFIAIEFGKEEGKKLISEYEDELRAYCTDLVAYQCPEFSLTKEVPTGYEELNVKLAEEFTSYHVQDITMLRNTLSRLLAVEPHVFHLTSVEEGCVLITWVVPSAVAQHIISAVFQCMEDLKKLNVIHVSTPSFGDVIIETQETPYAVDDGMRKKPAPLAKEERHDSCCRGSLLLKRLSAEEEILSVYSGLSSCLSRPASLTSETAITRRSLSLQRSNDSANISTLQDSSIPEVPESDVDKFLSKRKFASEADLLSKVELTPRVSVRSKSRGNLSEGSNRPFSSWSPFKFLPKFLRRGRSLSEPTITKQRREENVIQIVELAEEPRFRFDVHYYNSSEEVNKLVNEITMPLVTSLTEIVEDDECMLSIEGSVHVPDKYSDDQCLPPTVSSPTSHATESSISESCLARSIEMSDETNISLPSIAETSPVFNAKPVSDSNLKLNAEASAHADEYVASTESSFDTLCSMKTSRCKRSESYPRKKMCLTQPEDQPPASFMCNKDKDSSTSTSDYFSLSSQDNIATSVDKRMPSFNSHWPCGGCSRSRKIPSPARRNSFNN